jgi:hypothetical protein
MSTEATSPTAASPFTCDRLPHEPDRWYARFELFRSLGPARTIDAAYRIAAIRDNLHAKRPGALWYDNARRWQWRERAQAWDNNQRENLRNLEADRRFDAREQRLDMIDRLLQESYHFLSKIELSRLDPDQALRHMPQVRLLFRDLLTAQRLELGLVDAESEPDAAIPQPFTNDELRLAQRQLEEWRADRAKRKNQDNPPCDTTS